MLALCFCLSNLKQIKTDRELISFPAKHIVRLITGLMSSSSTKGKTGMTYWNFGHFSFFCLQVCDTQNVVKTARLFLIRCLFRGRFLFETWFFIFFEKIYPEIQFSTDVAVWYCYSRTTKNEKQKYMLPFLTCWVLLKAMFVLLKIFQTTDNWQFF